MDDHERSYAPTCWRRIQAINGRGPLLLGPNELTSAPGALVIAPPGVLLRSPVGGPPLTAGGWRLACWSPDRDGHVLIDQARPVGLTEVSLGQVVEDLANWAPMHLIWVASIVERQLRILIGRMSRDCHGRMHPEAAEAFPELIATRRAADDAFERLRAHPYEAPDWLVDRPFMRIEKTYLDELATDRERTKAAKRGTEEHSTAAAHDLPPYFFNPTIDPGFQGPS